MACEDLAHDQPSWRRAVKIGRTVYEANWTATAKAEREAHESQASLARNISIRPSQHARAVNEHFARGPVSSDIPRLNAPTNSQTTRMLPSRPLLLQTPRRPLGPPSSPPMIHSWCPDPVGWPHLHHPCHNLRDDDDRHHSSQSGHRTKPFQRPVDHHRYFYRPHPEM
ncbi:hypothetical protein SprV_0802581500 [Sparganum proliferum]